MQKTIRFHRRISSKKPGPTPVHCITPRKTTERGGVEESYLPKTKTIAMAEGR